MNCILYFSEVAESGGSTGIAPFSAVDEPLIPRTYSVVDDWGIRRDNTHPLYARELSVDVSREPLSLLHVARQPARSH